MPAIGKIVRILTHKLGESERDGWEEWRAPRITEELARLIRKHGESLEGVKNLFEEGKLVFKGKLFLRPAGRFYDIHLKLALPLPYPSCRFHREYGANSFLRIDLDKESSTKVDDDKLRKELQPFLLDKPLLVLGKGFQPFWHDEKDAIKTIHFFSTYEIRTSDFFFNYIDLELKGNRCIQWSKLTSRIQLGFSTTVRT